MTDRRQAIRPETLAKPIDPHAWGLQFEATYISKSQAASKVRSKRRSRQAVSSTPLTGTDLALRDVIRERQASKRALVLLRHKRGFVWSGGAFAGNAAYQREAFHYTGLVSDGHPILKLFVSKLHRAKSLRVGGTKAESSGSDSKLLALDAPYVQANKIACGIVRVELDAVLSWTAVRKACAEANVPLPNVAVAHVDNHGQAHRPHLLWLLQISGPLQGLSSGARMFRGLYNRTIRGLTHALLAIGADPDGLSNMHRHKNPVSPLWHRSIMAEAPYHLADLAAAVDTTLTKQALIDAATVARRRWPDRKPDHPDTEVAAGSNALFTQLRVWAQAEVVRVREAGGDEQEFKALVAQEACQMAVALTGDATGSERAALRTAAVVSGWTWNVYRIPAERAAPLVGDELRKRLVQGQASAATSRTTRTRAAILAAVATLIEQGLPVTQLAVAALTNKEGVCRERTVRRYWHLVKSARTENRPFAIPDVKKNQFSLPFILP